MADVVNRYISAYNAHDLDAVMQCYCAKPVAVGPGGPAEGRSEVASYHTGLWRAFPDVHATVLRRVADGDTTAVAAVGTGRHTGPFTISTGEVVQATWRYVSVRCCWFFDTEDGLIVDQQIFYDQMELYLQLGLSPVRLAGTCRGTRGSSVRRSRVPPAVSGSRRPRRAGRPPRARPRRGRSRCAGPGFSPEKCGCRKLPDWG